MVAVPAPPPRKLLTPAEAAGILGVCSRTVSNWARAGKIGCQRTMGGHRRYPEPEVTALADALTEAAA